MFDSHHNFDIYNYLNEKNIVNNMDINLKDEFLKYDSYHYYSNKDNPLLFWKKQEHNLPILYEISFQFLVI